MPIVSELNPAAVSRARKAITDGVIQSARVNRGRVRKNKDGTISVTISDMGLASAFSDELQKFGFTVERSLDRGSLLFTQALTKSGKSITFKVKVLGDWIDESKVKVLNKAAGVATMRVSKGANGTVKWFNNSKGYGFITPDDGSDPVFVHYSAIEPTPDMGGFRSLAEGQRVSYKVIQGPRGPHATEVSVEG